MARKSRYTSPLRDTSDVRPHCIAAIYLRLSVEDGDSLESNSIGNQRKICLAFWKSTAILKSAHFMWMMAAQA